MSAGSVLAFGPFRLDLRSRRLLRQNEPIALGARQFDLLHVFASKPGQILTKNSLIEAAWRDVAVTDNSLGFQAFGGSEFTFASMPRFAVSADLGYNRFPTPFAGVSFGGLGVSFSGHWYVH